MRTSLPLLATLGTVLAGPAFATVAPDDPFAGLTPVGRSDLGDMRGGMMVGGISADFAVVVATTAQGATGAPAGLQTTLAINDAGGIAGSRTTTTGSAPVMADAQGLMLSLAGGATGVIQQVLNNQVQTLITNAANGISISHSTTIDVTLPGFQAATRTYGSQLRAAHMGWDSAVAGLGRR